MTSLIPSLQADAAAPVVSAAPTTMTPSGSAPLPWQRAATLAERLDSAPTEPDDELGRLRYARWRTLPAFRAPGATEESAIRPLGVTPELLRELLGEPDASLRARLGDAPAWVRTFEELWATGTRQMEEDREHIPDLRLLAPVLPLVLGARVALAERARAALGAGSSRYLDADLAEQVVTAMVDDPPMDELSLIVVPTTVLEVNVARESGLLHGETPQERFDDFVHLMSNPERSRALLAEYPVLARAATERLTFWIERRTELAEHLVADLDAIVETLWHRPPSTLTVDFGQGDSHRRGRSVAIVRTDAGAVVYKPRRSDMDAAYGDVVDWFNRHTPQLDLGLPLRIGRGDYAWFEFVVAQPVTDDDAADRCVWRAGATNAIMHALQATDMHHENLVLAGEHPYPVDLESLLHTDKRYATVVEQVVPNIAHEALNGSALSVGILPNTIITGHGADVVATDITPLGYRGGQVGNLTMAQVQGDETDEVRLGNARPPLDPEDADDADRPADGFLLRPEAFESGFTAAYALIASQRAEWAAPGGLLDGFRGARTRYIPRPTMIYAKVLSESYHPDFMRDGLDRALCLGKLLAGYTDRPVRDAMIAGEVDDLLVGDIPFFEIDVATGSILRLDGEESIERDGDTPLEVVRAVVGAMGPADAEIQRQVIRYSFASALLAGRDATGSDAHAEDEVDLAALLPPTMPDPARREEKIEAALEVSQLLLDRMVRRPGGVGWLSLTAVAERHWVISPAVMDTYAGLSGIGLGLTAVGQIAGDERISAAAEEVMDQVVGYDPLILTDPTSIEKTREAFGTGAYGHLTGMAVALAHTGARFGRADYTRTALRALDLMAHLADTDTDHDIVAGNAGAVLGVLAVMERAEVPGGRAILSRLVRRLIDAGQERDGRWSWPQAGGGTPLVGFSHGTTGIALALARAGRLLGDRDAATVAAGALEYDRQHLVRATGDWVDLRTEARDTDDGEMHMRAWCHGSPGAGLGRAELVALDLLPAVREPVEAELALAARATAEAVLYRPGEPVGTGNHSLCHGDIGNLLALEAMWAPSMAPGEVAERTGRTWADLMRRGRDEGWACGVPAGVVVPGLMMGLAGIAWGLAYGAAPEGQLDVLTLRTRVQGGGAA
ncbi:type 2 lanthipeptide synthetase LanM [Georgenia sp. MJ206]|uniref:type 2 lanthipeptide synthetase LanM n=1 Tax=Georgenia wangjunii TaxID=3117730 RepID=UPI002F26A676